MRLAILGQAAGARTETLGPVADEWRSASLANPVMLTPCFHWLPPCLSGRKRESRERDCALAFRCPLACFPQCSQLIRVTSTRRLFIPPYRQVRDAKQARVIGRWLHPTASPSGPDRPHQRADGRRLAARSHPRQRGAAGTRRPVTTPRTNWTSVPSAGPASWHARDSSGIRG